MRDLVIERFDRINCIPVARKQEFGMSFQIGAYHPDGQFLTSVALRRNFGISGRALPVPAKLAKPGVYLYGGLLRRHYGHFLLESLARVYALQDSDLPIVWHLESLSGLTSWQHEIFSLLGVDVGRFVFVEQPTEFATLLVPEVGYRIQDWMHPRQENAMGRYTFSQPVRGKRIWLSRSRLAEEAGNVVAVTDIENALEANGWHIIHPQELTIHDQLGIMSDAEVISGFAGSAFHTLILASQIRARIVIVQRSETLNENYVTIAEGKGLDQTIIEPDLLKVRGAAALAQFQLKDAPRLIAELARL
jgi:capsular polysaccharide biosynthesis protein